MGEKTHWSHLRQKLVSACPLGHPINGFEVYDAPLPLTNMGEWKKLRSVPMCAAIRTGADAVKAARKALGKAAVGKRLIGEPAHLFSTEGGLVS
jgi:hypothetical protein